jgi:hypothetical protein
MWNQTAGGAVIQGIFMVFLLVGLYGVSSGISIAYQFRKTWKQSEKLAPLLASLWENANVTESIAACRRFPQSHLSKSILPGLIAFSSSYNLMTQQRFPSILYKNLINQALWDQENFLRQKIDRLNSIKYTLLAIGALLAFGFALKGIGAESSFYSLIEPVEGAYIIFLMLYFWFVLVGFIHHGLLARFKRLLGETQLSTSEWLASLPADIKEN